MVNPHGDWIEVVSVKFEYVEVDFHTFFSFLQKNEFLDEILYQRWTKLAEPPIFQGFFLQSNIFGSVQLDSSKIDQIFLYIALKYGNKSCMTAAFWVSYTYGWQAKLKGTYVVKYFMHCLIAVIWNKIQKIRGSRFSKRE